MRKRDQDRALRKAAVLIRKGWITGSFESQGCYCAMGAINAQTGYKPAKDNSDKVINDTDQLYKRLAEYISGKPVLLGKYFGVIENFNDHVASGADHVAEVLVGASYA